ncbi:ABC-2 type transport system permease protein [Anaerotaenia torta]|uniref:putative ABC transporter permease subunit n=1 Tax=Anaerotaenia torta TaxID=433293 RepID=UPI003D1F8E9F
MKKIIRLIRVQLWAVLADTLSMGQHKTKKPRMIYLGLGLFAGGMGILSAFYNFILGFALMSVQRIDLLPPLMMALTCIILVITTVWKVRGTVFGFRDYDLVMSLPVGTGGVVASRLIILYIINLFFVAIIILPMIAAYGILTGQSLLFYLTGLVSMMFVPLVPIVIASFLGTLIAYMASKFRHRNLMNIIFSMGLVLFILASSFSLGESGEEMLNIGVDLTKQVYSLYPLAKLYTGALVEQRALDFLLFAGISALAFFLYVWVVQRIFKSLNTVFMTGRGGAKFKLGILKTASPLKALYRKELKRYFSSVPYVLNSGIGIVMLTAASVALLFLDRETVFGNEIPESFMGIIAPMLLSFCIMLSSTTMASISLEGKNLWILKSLPVEPKTIYDSKLLVNLTILAPVPVDALLLGIGLGLDAAATVCLMVFGVACGLFVAVFGLLVNLLLPNFQWSIETVVVKQSAPSLIVVFGGMGITCVLSAVFFLIGNSVAAYLTCILLLLTGCGVLYWILMSYGKKRFASLL